MSSSRPLKTFEKEILLEITPLKRWFLILHQAPQEGFLLFFLNSQHHFLKACRGWIYKWKISGKNIQKTKWKAQAKRIDMNKVTSMWINKSNSILFYIQRLKRLHRKQNQAAQKWQLNRNHRVWWKFPCGKSSPRPPHRQLHSLGTNTQGQSLRAKTAEGREKSLCSHSCSFQRVGFPCSRCLSTGSATPGASQPCQKQLSWYSRACGFYQYLQWGGVFMILNIHLIPIYIPASFPSVSFPQKNQIYPWLSRQKVPPLSPFVVLGGLSKNPAVLKTSPGRLQGAFPNIPARFTNPTFCSRSQNHSRIFRGAPLPRWHLHELSLQCPLIQID